MPKRDPLDAVVGAIAGVLFGATSGLAISLLLLPDRFRLFPGDLMVLGAVVCAGLGYWRGNDFFRWLRDHWFDW
jgi:hypothetical protein